MHRASWRRHREGDSDRALLDPPQLVANISGQLELLGLDRSLETIAQLGRARDVRKLRWKWSDVAAPDMARIAVDSPQQIAQARFECLVTVGAPKPPGSAEIGECRLAERAVNRLALGARHLLVNCL